MGWRIVYIEDAKSVKLYLDNVRIEKEVGVLTIPLSDIHTLIIDNQMISLTVPLLNKCSDYNINLVLCDLEHMPNVTLNPFNGNYQTPLMLKKQIEWSNEIKKILHVKIIKNKIENQVDLLKHLDKNIVVIEKILTFSREIEEDDCTNREGLAAKMYFREMFGASFKRFDDDIINAGLNYGYSILRSQISKTIIAKGLNTTLGIFHKGYNNSFNLSDDIIEVFRPLIDEYVYKNMLDAVIFTRKHRIELISLTTKDSNFNGEKQSIFNVISMFIDKIIYCFETGDMNGYKPVRLIYEL